MNFLTDDPLWVIGQMTENTLKEHPIAYKDFVVPVISPATPRSFYDNMEKKIMGLVEEPKRLEWTDPYVWDREYEVERI